MALPARALALRVLRRLAEGGVTLGDALARPEVEALPERDRALLNELVHGALRRRGFIDHVLAGLSTRPLSRVSPGVLDALRLGVYQVLYLRVPPHAAVSETVELARSVEAGAAGFANAILRRLLREGPPAEPDGARDPLAWLTSAGSLPRWLAERWCGQLGPVAAVARARVLLDPPPVHFRLNPRADGGPARLAEAGVEARETGVPGALVALSGRLAPLAAAGLVYVQDAGSQLVAHLAASEGRVLDACAAPGGKALLMADLGGSRTRVFAAEASRRRLVILARLRSRWGAANVRVLGADGLRPPFAGAFDAVLLDAPCTGLGTLARNPDARWRVVPADLPRQGLRQRALLESLAPLVRPGGRLVYATCSVEPEETEDVVMPFLDAHPEFGCEDLPPWAEPFRAGAFVRTDHVRDGGDAFFAARLRRAGRARGLW